LYRIAIVLFYGFLDSIVRHFHWISIQFERS